MNFPSLQAPLSLEIQKEYSRLTKLISSIPAPLRILKKIKGTGGTVSITDLIAYQIGWGSLVIGWYDAGIRGETPKMSGEGFTNWNYVAIAQYFYQKYNFNNDKDLQTRAFLQVFMRLITIVEQEYQTGNLDKLGVWPWCTLPSGKQWPLSKWIKVNTSSPYKRAFTLINSGYAKNYF
ncbi:MAG: ClbS/DfsB family four-helix bundle protein [Chlamydiales bacterium]|nr:ClbS/DfsB family four-helix bundle protein [Chlamydiales bacterium]